MPALEMRGRYIMREFWSDSDLFLRMNADEREFYVGLWMLADDAGWMPRDVPAIAAALYRYEDRTTRERRVVEHLSKLREMGKVESHRCCIQVPVVVRYPRSGKRSESHWGEHQKHSNRSKRIRTDLTLTVPSSPDLTRPTAHAPTPEGEGGASAESEFRKRVPFPLGSKSA